MCNDPPVEIDQITCILVSIIKRNKVLASGQAIRAACYTVLRPTVQPNIEGENDAKRRDGPSPN